MQDMKWYGRAVPAFVCFGLRVLMLQVLWNQCFQGVLLRGSFCTLSIKHFWVMHGGALAELNATVRFVRALLFRKRSCVVFR